jgi:hypothetical protein
MFAERVSKLAVSGTLLVFVALVVHATAGRPRAEEIPSNPTILQAIKNLQNSVNGLQKKHFYLTKSSVDGLGVLTACTTGFHTASLWEILDPSNLRYDTVLGFTTDDSGSGPPAAVSGWIRTGSAAADSGSAGVNCNAYTNNTGEGTIVELDWGETSGSFPWASADEGCNLTRHVWCVQN